MRLFWCESFNKNKYENSKTLGNLRDDKNLCSNHLTVYVFSDTYDHLAMDAVALRPL